MLVGPSTGERASFQTEQPVEGDYNGMIRQVDGKATERDVRE